MKGQHTARVTTSSHHPAKLRSGHKEPPIRKWFHDHDRLVTVVGAIIIFVTFIAKEWYGENLKDLKQSIDSGQAVFVLQNENRTIQQRLAWLWTLDSNTYTNVLTTPRPDPSKITLQSEESQSQFTFDSIFRMKDQFDAATRMLKNIPHDKTKDDELKKLRARCEEASKKFKGFTSPGSSTPQSELEQAFRAMLAIERETLSVEDDLDKFSTEFFVESHEVQEKKEREYRLAKYVAIGFYTVGWSLTLLGKLYGPKREEEASEG